MSEANQNERVVMPIGHLPDFEGKPVLASCEHCAHLSDESDGPEYGPSWYTCVKKGKEHMGNLKGFPFRTAQECCQLSIGFVVDWAKEAGKVIPFPVRIKHTPESQQFADILHEHWPEEFTPNGDRR